MFQGTDRSDVGPTVDESAQREYVDAKAFLLQTSTATGANLYDHLSSILMRVLEERPNNAVDMLEELSAEEKRSRFTTKEDSIFDKSEKSTDVALAESHRKLFTGGRTEEEDDDDPEPEDDEESPLPDLMKLSFYFEQAGVGLSREEMVRIWLSLKTLVKAHKFSSVRFWGKVFGIENNYLVAEVQYVEGEEEEDEEDTEETQNANDEKGSRIDEEDEDVEAEDPPPVSAYKPPPVIEKEASGTGVNKMTYFVSTDPGKAWLKLPSVTPAQLSAARKIKKFFTGILDAPVSSYPPFPGVEKNYLRAQIARISAGTQISPVGYFQFDEEEEPEEGDIRDGYVENEEYEPLPVRELVDPGLENWVHHTLHILPQGRVRWWDPKQAEEEEEEAEDDEEKSEPEEAEPEVGPPLLTPLSEDADLNGMPAWTTRISSKLVPKYAVAVIRSVLWPGAHAFAMESTFENIYIGWGHKYLVDNFTPELPPAPQEEFPSGPDVTEADDPTVDAEQALKASLEPDEEEDEDEDGSNVGDDDEDDD
jgi:radial spoke head protein 4A